ncbi:phage holin family protein [Oryzobacter terrae]|uniref:phage holin family protein n=1 Tax=Oryzobacter terrae TaxID=1620385 RepID=UPI003671358D
MTEHQTRPDLPEPSLRSVGELLGDITTDLSVLVRQEVELAKAEVRESADHAKAGGAMLGTAAVAGHLFLVFLSVAAWWALGDAIGRGWSALVVALVWAIVAAITASIGRKRLKRVAPVAPRTIDTTTEIPDALRGRHS